MGRIDTQESGKLVGRKSGVLAKELDLVPGQQSTLANDFTRKEIMKLFDARDDRKLRVAARTIVDVDSREEHVLEPAQNVLVRLLYCGNPIDHCHIFTPKAPHRASTPLCDEENGNDHEQTVDLHRASGRVSIDGCPFDPSG